MSKFLTPPDVPEEVVCRTLRIPNSLAWLGIFNKALLAPTYYYNWSDDVAGNMSREDAAAAALVIVTEYFNASLECDTCLSPLGDPFFRVGVGGEIQELTDGVWLPPSGEYTIPAVPARDEPTSEENICLAAMNAANALALLYEAVSDQYNSEIDPLLGIAALVLAAGAILTFPFAPIVAGILLWLELPFAIFYATIETASSDFWDAEFTRKLTCVLVEVATDLAGVVTFDFEALIARLAAGTDLFDPTVTELILFGQVDFLLRTLGVEGLNHAGATTAITTPDCPCNLHCYLVDLTVTDPASVGIVINHGTWVSGQGIRGDFLPPDNANDTYGSWNFPEQVELFAFAMEYTKTTGAGSGSDVNNLRLSNTPPVVYGSAIVAQDVNNGYGSNIVKQIDYAGQVAGAYWDINSGVTPATIYIIRLWVYYSGEIVPEWEDNC